MTSLLAGRIARAGGVADGWIEIDGPLIAATGGGKPPRPPDDHADGLVSAGLVDLQVNGAAGFEVTAGEDGLEAIEQALLRRGVTSWLPTVISTDDAEAERIVEALARRAVDPHSSVAGIHVEGPFLAAAHAGMHRPEFLRSPSDGIPEYLQHPAVRLVTLAPELPGAHGLVADLTGAGVTVSLGHTGADAATTLRAVDAGARMVTHLFNAMAPLAARAPGVAAVALTDRRLAIGLIADGVHVDPLVLRVVRAAAADRVVLVSDASPAAASPVPVATFAGVALDPDGRAGGRPAGSLCLLDEDVVTWAATTGERRAVALDAAIVRSAALAGLPAPLASGSPADLVEWDDAGRARRVMRHGRWLGAA